VNSQRFNQGEIDNFDVRVRVVVGDVIFAENKRTKTNAGSKPDLLIQNSPC
jgi:hypothetical protein